MGTMSWPLAVFFLPMTLQSLLHDRNQKRPAFHVHADMKLRILLTIHPAFFLSCLSLFLKDVAIISVGKGQIT